MIVRETAFLAGTGTLLGLIGAYVLSPSMAGLLFATSPHDPVAFTGVALVLMLVTMAAAAIPARRAVHQEPVFLLRNTSPST
jgi:ABC-type antimicrobial peptide transport system permease subunit